MAPEQLGKYEIRGTLGKGAMGTVYAAWDPVISRQVAIKTVRLPDAGDIDSQEELARFKREAQAAGRLTHPNIVGIFDYGETNELAYIVMEFVDGRTLKSVLDGEERLPVATVVRIMTDLLAGLQYSHERGVVHRDIKPANVMIVGTGGQAKIADFGIARIESSNLTQAGTIMGTPAYMSPEQFMGQTVDARTDIYSSGVLLFQLLTGERPFEGSMATIMHKALNTQPPRPSELSVTAPVTLDAVVAQAMARRPDDRFASAAAFSDSIRTALEKGAQPASRSPDLDGDATIVHQTPRPTTRPVEAPPPERVRRRSRAPLLASVAFIALAAAGGGGAWWFGMFNPPIPPSTPGTSTTVATTTVATTTDGKTDVVAVTPPVAPVPPVQPSAERPAQAAPADTSPTTTAAANPPAPARSPPEPRPELTQVVPPSTEPAHPPASPPAPRQPAQIVPPAEPQRAPAPNPVAADAPRHAAPDDPPARARPPGRVDVGNIPLEPAVTPPPAPAVSPPARTQAAADPPAATPPLPPVVSPPVRVEPQPAPVAATPPALPPPVVSPPASSTGRGGTSEPPPPSRVASADPVSPPADVPAAETPASPPPATRTPEPQVTEGEPANPTRKPDQGPPPTLAEAGIAPDALRRAVASVAQGADCAVLYGGFDIDGKFLSVGGVVGSGGPIQAVLKQIHEVAPNVAMDWSVREAPGAYCGALNLVRPYASWFSGAATGGIHVELKDRRNDLLADDPIDVRTTVASFPAYLQIDYFSSDGSVAHLRTSAQGTPALAARSTQGFVAGAAAPPFGTDLIVAVASSTPLFAKNRPLADTTDAYLRELRTALEAAKQRHAEIAAGVTVVHTGPKT